MAASLRLQHAFESTHGAQACRDLIEAYAAKPLTEDAMREACGLPPRQRSDQVHANMNLPVDKSSQDERDHLHEQLKNLLPAIMEHCLEKCKCFKITKGMWKYVKLPPDHPSHLDRDPIWDALLHHNLLRKVEQRNDRYKDAAMPVISFDAAFRRLVPTQANSWQITHEEVHDLEAARKYIIGNGDRESNVATVLQHLDLVGKSLKHHGKKGRQEG